MKILEETLSIIKPDGVERNLIGKILTKFEQNGLTIAAIKIKKLSLHEAKQFYIVHKDRNFYDELVNYMTRSKVLILVLKGHNAVNKNREIMGATDPKNAAEGSIRQLFAKSIGENTVHGSDSLENAGTEIAFFFSRSEII